MGKGFIVTCVQCGNKAEFTQVRDKEDGYEFVDSSNDTLTTKTSGGYGYYGISCSKCGNEVEGEY